MCAEYYIVGVMSVKVGELSIIVGVVSIISFVYSRC